MSADNRLCLMPWGGSQWFAWHGSGSEEYHQPPSYAQVFNTRGEAEEWIETEEKRIEYLEYGVTLIGREEQESALVGTIEDCQQRLYHLRKTGRQYPNWSEQT